MTMVHVFWFGSQPLRSPRSGIKPHSSVLYDERIAKDLVRTDGDRIMVLSDNKKKALYIGRKVDAEYIVHRFPHLKADIEKAVGKKIVTTVFDVIAQSASSELSELERYEREKMHAFLGLDPEGNDLTSATDPIASNQVSDDPKIEDTSIVKKRGRPKKAAQESTTESTEI